MRPDSERGRPGGAASEVDHTGDGVDMSNVDDAADVWTTVRDGWVCAGDAMPKRGSLAWLALPDDDPVRAAAVAVVELDAAAEVRAHGPGVARRLAEVAG